jgi:uncharacterized glyoxalase superfamily protein PhnB
MADALVLRQVNLLGVRTRDDVDRICRRVVDGGFACRQPPFDAFWGARFAVVADHDGNQFGLMSPIDEGRRLRG